MQTVYTRLIIFRFHCRETLYPRASTPPPAPVTTTTTPRRSSPCFGAAGLEASVVSICRSHRLFARHRRQPRCNQRLHRARRRVVETVTRPGWRYRCAGRHPCMRRQMLLPLRRRRRQLVSSCARSGNTSPPHAGGGGMSRDLFSIGVFSATAEERIIHRRRR